MRRCDALELFLSPSYGARSYCSFDSLLPNLIFARKRSVRPLYCSISWSSAFLTDGIRDWRWKCQLQVAPFRSSLTAGSPRLRLPIGNPLSFEFPASFGRRSLRRLVLRRGPYCLLLPFSVFSIHSLGRSESSISLRNAIRKKSERGQGGAKRGERGSAFPRESEPVHSVERKA